MKFTVVSSIPGINPHDVYRVFDNRLLAALSPPFAKPVTIHYGGNRPGDRLHFELRTPLGRKTWKGEVTEENRSETEIYFVDEGREMPFGLVAWRHKHRLLKTPTGTQIRDEVQFVAKNSLLTTILWPVLWVQFLYRKPLYAKTIWGMLASHANSTG